MSRRKRVLLLNILLPLMIGGLFYDIFCSDTLFVQYLDRLLPVNIHLHLNRENGALKLFRWYGADALWAWSLTFALWGCIGSGVVDEKKAVFLAGGLLTVMEVLQLFPWMKGTFDPWDLVVEFITVLTAATCMKRIEKGEDEK